MAAKVIAEVVRRSAIAPASVDEVFFGCANQAGEDNRNVARMATLLAGLPDSVPAVTLNRLCASGLEAINQAARAIWVGDMEVVVAGGVESMTRAPFSTPKPDEMFPVGNRTMYDTTLGWRYPNPKMEALFPLEGMGETAENLAERYEIGRAEQDRFALQSHAKAVAAQAEGRFEAELLAVRIPQRKKDDLVVESDECPRGDSSLESLGRLPAVFRKGGTVTAGNSSPLSDGASALLMMSDTRAAALGLEPLARIRAVASAGVSPRFMGIGPVPAVQKALNRLGMQAKDLELIELNEAFAVQSLAVIRELGLDVEKVNVNGGALALGHPLGCSGARIMTSLVHEMKRRGVRWGLATLCVGVGQGVATMVERS